MSEREALLPLAPTRSEQKRKHQETHIACEGSTDVALCGARRQTPWWLGDPGSEATCVVCLDVWKGETFGE